jgi:signal peptidase
MKSVRFVGMTLLLIFLLIGGSISANILSENHIEQNSSKIRQLMVSVDSGSMMPYINIGDLVVVENASKSDIITYDEAELTGYKAFNLSGDVILYRPYGQEKVEPIISRAMRYVNAGEPMWGGGPAAPFSGYITKGDHNEVIDQMAGQIFGTANTSYIEKHRDEVMDVGSDVYLDKKTGLLIYKTENGTFVGEGISFLTPVKEEWVIGIVRAKIPYGSDWTKLPFS